MLETGGGPGLFSYVRYDPDVTAEGLDRLGLSGLDPSHDRMMDST